MYFRARITHYIIFYHIFENYTMSISAGLGFPPWQRALRQIHGAFFAEARVWALFGCFPLDGRAWEAKNTADVQGAWPDEQAE